MKKTANIFLILLVSISLLNCEDTYLPPALDYVTFSESVYNTGVEPGGSTTVDITVYTAKVNSSDTTYNLIVDGSNAADGSYDVPSSVVIPGGTNEGIITVSLSDVNLGIGVNSISISFEGGIVDAYQGESTTLKYIQNCNEVTGTLDITFDYYAEETGWQIIDALGGVVMSKPEGAYANGQAPVSENITLCAGRDYTLTFTDAYADGMNDGDNLGSYSLSIGGVVKATGGGSFGASESNTFDTN